MPNWMWLALGGVGLLLVFGLFIVMVNFGRLYIMAWFAGVRVGIFELIGMWMRGVNASAIVNTKIQAWKAGLTEITTEDLETHYLARGRVPNVVHALVSAQRANIPMDFRTACAIDLAGRDIVDAVHTSVNPKVIDCPNPAAGRSTIDAVAKDGIQLKVTRASRAGSWPATCRNR